jgi:hypothetical protein
MECGRILPDSRSQSSQPLLLLLPHALRRSCCQTDASETQIASIAGRYLARCLVSLVVCHAAAYIESTVASEQ